MLVRFLGVRIATPGGAAGVYQIVEVGEQWRGEGWAGQIPAAKIGMAQNIGGSSATIVTHILQAR